MSTNVHWLAYCRAGFEIECLQELSKDTASQHLTSTHWTEMNAAWVRYQDVSDTSTKLTLTHWRELCFARQLLRVIAEWNDLGSNRLAPVIEQLIENQLRVCDVWVEHADCAQGQELNNLCRSLEAAALSALRKKNLIDTSSTHRLHLFVLSGKHLLMCLADTQYAAPWRMGIPRLKFPKDAPSRSTLKLDEAFTVLLNDQERQTFLKPGMTAVDLGAAPGGWTYQLTRRSLRVTAVDNGAMHPSLLSSGLVEHRRVDGFHFTPRKPVDWLVCDMVEQPSKITQLMARWLQQAWCRRCVFNLKLPMKKRYQETQQCLETLRAAVSHLGTLDLRAKQLYHDREEITVFAQVKR
jgi:23S rRNA (cytidine2498-2'-O)-methyltransferase